DQSGQHGRVVDEAGIDFQVQEALHDGESVIGVQGGVGAMAGGCQGKGGYCRFVVTHLTHAGDVRVQSHHVLDRPGPVRVVVRVSIDVGVVHAGDFVLHRVFDGEHMKLPVEVID